MDEQTKRNNEQASEKYNRMWRYPYWAETDRLYRAAATSASFGCHLQDEVLTRLGARIDTHHTRPHYGRAALAWIDWMTTQGGEA